MAFGLTGNNAYDLAAETNTTIYTCPAGKVASVNIRFTNRNATDVTIRLALVESGGTIGNKNYVEYDVSIPANGVLEDTAIVLSAGDTAVGYASAAGVSVMVKGFEE